MTIETCPLCGSNNLRQILSTKDYITNTTHQLWQCNECNLAFVNPQPEDNEIGNYYPAMYYGDNPFAYEKIDAFFRLKSVQKLGLIPGKALDCGCGKGLLLGHLKKLCWMVRGTELSEMSARYGINKLGIDVCNKKLENCDYDDNEFDLIMMFHSLEHFHKPFLALKEINRILKPGGRLIIEVPRAQGMAWNFFKQHWFHLDIPRHLYHFTDATLERALVQAGFKVINKKKYDIMYDSFGIIQSLLNMVCKNFNLLNDINTKRKTIGSILQSKDKRLIAEAFACLLFQGIFYIPALLVTTTLAIANNGGTLSYVSEKTQIAL